MYLRPICMLYFVYIFKIIKNSATFANVDKF